MAAFEADEATIRSGAIAQNKKAEAAIVKLRGIIADLKRPGSEKYLASEKVVGGFIPPDEILIQEAKYTEDNLALDSLASFSRLLVHEWLHYHGDDGMAGALKPFVFEGVTEYLALTALGYSEHSIVVWSGYPIHIQIMELLAQKMPRSVLEDIHFSQEGSRFEAAFKKYFPESNLDDFLDLGSRITTSWFIGPQKDNFDYFDDSFVI